MPKFRKSEEAVAVAGETSLYTFLLPSMKITEPSAAANVDLWLETLVGNMSRVAVAQLAVRFGVTL